MKKILLLLLLCVASGVWAMKEVQKDNYIALMRALSVGDSESVCSLSKDLEVDKLSSGLKEELVADANPNEKYEDGDFPLHRAASSNLFDCIRILLEMGADPHCQDSWGGTPLHRAAMGSYYFGGEQGDFWESVQVLVGCKSVDVNVLDYDNRDPLYKAAYYGRLKSGELLLDVGADPCKKYSIGDVTSRETEKQKNLMYFVCEKLEARAPYEKKLIETYTKIVELLQNYQTT